MPSSALSVKDRLLLLQLGDRLKRLRQDLGLSGVDLAARACISRTTLSAIEAGDPGSFLGTYVRVMSSLGLSGDLAWLVSDARRLGPMVPAAAGERAPRSTLESAPCQRNGLSGSPAWPSAGRSE